MERIVEVKFMRIRRPRKDKDREWICKGKRKTCKKNVINVAVRSLFWIKRIVRKRRKINSIKKRKTMNTTEKRITRWWKIREMRKPRAKRNFRFDEKIKKKNDWKNMWNNFYFIMYNVPTKDMEQIKDEKPAGAK